jgi:hypothetical protein
MEQVVIEYLNVPITYGNEFVCMVSNPLLTVTLNEHAIVQLVNNLFCCKNTPIVSKSLLSELSVFNAKPYNMICVSSNQEMGILESTIPGTWLTGSFTDLVLPSNVSVEQLKVIGSLLHQVQLAVISKEPFLCGFRNLTVCRESGVAIVCPALMCSPLLR